MPSSSINAITRMSATLKDLFIYIYDLSPLDMDLLLTLIKYNDKQMTLEDLSKAVNRDKSTVFRSLQKVSRRRDAQSVRLRRLSHRAGAKTTAENNRAGAKVQGAFARNET